MLLGYQDIAAYAAMPQNPGRQREVSRSGRYSCWPPPWIYIKPTANRAVFPIEEEAGAELSDRVSDSGTIGKQGKERAKQMREKLKDFRSSRRAGRRLAG
jgi:hypothetical protein